MTVRFLADENLSRSIVQGLRSREPAIDILDVKSGGLRGTKDPVLLELAAVHRRASSASLRASTASFLVALAVIYFNWRGLATITS